MSRTPLSIRAIEDRADEIAALPEAELRSGAVALAREMLAMGEDVLDTWLVARDQEPTREKTEGFRLLALHRQASRGNPSFNACRETSRELVYHHNLVLDDFDAPEVPRTLRLQAMVLRHLALFIGGKLEVEGLGEFCCSSRPIRQAEASAVE